MASNSKTFGDGKIATVLLVFWEKSGLKFWLKEQNLKYERKKTKTQKTFAKQYSLSWQPVKLNQISCTQLERSNWIEYETRAVNCQDLAKNERKLKTKTNQVSSKNQSQMFLLFLFSNFDPIEVVFSRIIIGAFTLSSNIRIDRMKGQMEDKVMQCLDIKAWQSNVWTQW